MSIARTSIVDDDGTLTTGTIWNNAWKQELYDQIDAAFTDRPGTSAPTTTGTQTALAIPSGTGDLVIYANNASLLTVQGIAAGLQGQRLTIFSKGAGQIDFANLHASGTALGKLKLFATSGLTSLAAGIGVAAFVYDATVTQWRLAAHEQGDWITPTFDSLHYAGSGSMTWGLTSGDRTGQAYWLRGRSVKSRFALDTTSVGGTTSTDLLIKNGAWGGFTAASGQWNGTIYHAQDKGVLVECFIQINGGGTSLRILKKTFATWDITSVNQTEAYGEIELGVA